jgi:hypothetical protein
MTINNKNDEQQGWRQFAKLMIGSKGNDKQQQYKCNKKQPQENMQTMQKDTQKKNNNKWAHNELGS